MAEQRRSWPELAGVEQEATTAAAACEKGIGRGIVRERGVRV